MYKYLAVSGGGVKGVTLIGGLTVLHKLGLLNEVEEYVGSSIGGVLVTLLSLGFTPSELYHITVNIDATRFMNVNFIEALDRLGLDKGDKVVKLFRSIMKIKGAPDMTFAEHYKISGGKLLTLSGTCINDQQLYFFNKDTFPNLRVIDAVRATIGFPLFFTPMKLLVPIGGFDARYGRDIRIFKDGVDVSDVEVVDSGRFEFFVERMFIDGAFLSPNPAKFYEGRDIDLRKLVILMNHCEHKYVGNDQFGNNPLDFLTTILNTFKMSYVAHHLVGFEDRVIKFYSNEFPMNFAISREKKFKMYSRGCLGALLWMFSAVKGGQCGDCERWMLWRGFERLKRVGEC